MEYIGYIIAGVFAGAIVTAFIAAKKGKKKIEFSKVVLMLVLSTYFIGVFVGVKIVFIDVSQLGVVLAFIGTPTAAAIAFYCWKAKAENLLKIKKENPEITEVPIDFNNISSQ
ncbi:hypothetical protein [Tepidibacter thalassicus]|uniref:Uncharacterized protein n=1 Tax=Tepidibacter thalassicus DSM 15285 TaxID=1123350 RepID=A0A1M5NNT6_9FIRM|nr:hypothetical protein [Tepidibacter thalassicus]SHG90859.1 hypothetical protein SAMN02744040_00126 [Tepidibacter thalassicus DSM 15285]